MRILALLAVALPPLIASAEGEQGPMIGGALVATHDAGDAAGAELEMALWRGRFGVAAEGSYQRGLVGTESHVASFGGSVRVLLHQQLTPSLLDPREDVELGIELQGIVERAWRDDQALLRYGLGLAVRLRGGTDFSNVLAESRLFIRVLASPARTQAIIARTTMPESDRELAIIVGIGANFGGGAPDYVKRFRPRALDQMIE